MYALFTDNDNQIVLMKKGNDGNYRAVANFVTGAFGDNFMTARREAEKIRDLLNRNEDKR